MQDITDLPFWKLISRYGGADLYVTEYFRVHATSHLEKTILKSITENPTGRPVIAQMIGEDIPSLVRAARELQAYPIAGIDLNLGCPAPIVCRKKAGGGLLRDPHQVEAILSALREVVTVAFTVKTRLGFERLEEFDQFIPIYARHRLDLLTVHGRTIREMYRGAVHYDAIGRAVAALPFPVLANGNVDSAGKAVAVLNQTKARGVMIGRAAIGNPWIFRQIRQRLRGDPVRAPTGYEVGNYLRDLYVMVRPPGIRPRAHIEKMKKYLSFIGLLVDATGHFLFQARRLTTETEFYRLCETCLDHDRPLDLVPPKT
jgi:tRNA-dihydrouridine synthase